MSKATHIAGSIDIERQGSVWIARLDGGPHGLMGLSMAGELAALLDRLETEPDVDAVVFTGTHPGRFVGHADVRWLQEGGAAIPKMGRGLSSAVARTSKAVRGVPVLEAAAGLTPLDGGMQLDKLHDTFLRMNRSAVIFIAALNGSALGLGSEFAQACDVRLMADGNFFIGQPEILLGINPGGGGTQRLTRLLGTHKALMLMLEGRPVPPQTALEIGYVDEVVAPDEMLERAVERARYMGARPRLARQAIKRAAYFGSSATLEEGLHIERTEFIHIAPTDTAQVLMTEYLDRTQREGDLPFYEPAILEETLQKGALPVPGRGARV
jgi:enoyl-CoA hydratase/carnithine racemase